MGAGSAFASNRGSATGSGIVSSSTVSGMTTGSGWTSMAMGSGWAMIACATGAATTRGWTDGAVMVATGIAIGCWARAELPWVIGAA